MGETAGLTCEASQRLLAHAVAKRGADFQNCPAQAGNGGELGADFRRRWDPTSAFNKAIRDCLTDRTGGFSGAEQFGDDRFAAVEG